MVSEPAGILELIEIAAARPRVTANTTDSGWSGPSTDSFNRLQPANQVQTAMGELAALENKIVDMVDKPDADTDHRISKLEASSSREDLYVPRSEFFKYLEELQKDRKEVIEPLVLEGLAETRRGPYREGCYAICKKRVRTAAALTFVPAASISRSQQQPSATS